MKKFSRKFTALLLALSVIASMLTMASAAGTNFAGYEKYSDVPRGSWYERYVNAVTETAIMNGVGAGQFGPMTPCSRAMFVTILYRLAGSPGVKAASTMSDVVAGSWYADSVAWAQESGVTTGYADGTFGVNDTLNRQQMVTFLHRFAKYMGEDVSKSADISTYADASAVQSWAKEAISWAVGEGVIQGSDKGLEPANACTRAMAATVISRLNGLVKENVTRADLEEALVAAAWSYYAKGEKIQYCGRELNENFAKWHGGTWRLPLYATTEDATSHKHLYTVCSDFFYSVYDNALNYSFGGARCTTTVKGVWTLSAAYNNDLALFRWIVDGKLTDDEILYGMKPDIVTTNLDEARDFLRNWETNLRPGDAILFYTNDGSGGHVVVYIGNGYFLDSGGKSYTLQTGVELKESTGSVDELQKVEDIFLQGNSYMALDEKYEQDHRYFGVIRVLDSLVQDDGDGNPANDLLKADYVLPQHPHLKYDANVQTSSYNITPATMTRMENPVMEIDRTVNITPYGTTFTGDTLTYTLKITNKSNDASYKEFMTAKTGSAYAGQDYVGLSVKEIVPAGTEFVSASEGGTLSGNTLNWTVDVPAGKTVTLTYSVKVTAKQGEQIVSKGGFVENIPMTEIKNTVGGKKLPAEKVAALKTFADAGKKTWNSNEGYKISAKSTDTVFASRVYNEVMGMDLKLPSAQELLNNVFEIRKYETEHGFSYHYDETNTSWMYHLRDTAPRGYETIHKMVVKDFFGGDAVHTDRYSGEDRILEFRKEYLEPGDVIVFANITPYTGNDKARTVTDTLVQVYLGNGVYAAIDSTGAISCIKNDDTLWKAHSYDFFVALRPSQGYADISTEVAVYDKAKSPALTDADKDTSVDPWSEEALAADLQKVTVSDWETSGKKYANQKSFGTWIYSFIGRNIGDYLTKNMSSTVKNGIFQLVDGKYTVKQPAAEDHKPEAAMFVQGMFGGTKAVGGDPAKYDSKDDFKAGDLICMMRTEEDSTYTYGVGVYRGDGTFLYGTFNSTHKGNAGFIYTYEEMMNNITENKWHIFYVLRPSQVINAEQSAETEQPAAPAGVSQLESTDWDLYYVIRPSKVMTELNMADYGDKLKGLTSSAWEAGGRYCNQMSFGKWAYKELGIDVSSVITQNISYTTGHVGGNTVFSYDKQDKFYTKSTAPVDEKYENIAAMFVDGMYAGGKVDGNLDKMTAVENYQPGDLVCFIKSLGSSKFAYGMAIYQGDGSFFGAESTTKTSGILTFDQMKAAFSKK